jgi:hypothetical protein
VSRYNTPRPPIRWEDPPAWLADVPRDLLSVRGGDMMWPDQSAKLVRYLAKRGLPRPTLMQLESERRRRGIRRT